MKRTMEPVHEAMANLRKSQRVYVEQPGVVSQGTDHGPSVGVLPDVSRLVFPSRAHRAGVRPRPRTLLDRSSMPSGDVEGGGARSGEVDLVSVDVGEDDGGGIGEIAMPSVETRADGDGGSVGASQATREGEEVGGQTLAEDCSVRDRRVGKGLAGEVGGGGQVAIGDPCHVMPIQACSTLRTIAPKFGIEQRSSVLLQPWNSGPPEPRVEAPKPVPKPRSKPTCQTCGHLYTSGRFGTTMFHTKGVGGRLECLVPGLERRQPTFLKRPRGRFDTCVCQLCSE